MCDECSQTESADYVKGCPVSTQEGISGGVGAQCSRPMMEEEKLNDLFGYKFPTHATGPKFETIREAARHFARVVQMNVPYGTDRYIAIQKIREAVFLANSGISHDGLSL